MVDYSNLFHSGLKAMAQRPHGRSISLDIRVPRSSDGPSSAGTTHSFKTVDGYETRRSSETPRTARWRFLRKPEAPIQDLSAANTSPSEEPWVDIGDDLSGSEDSDSSSEYSHDSYEGNDNDENSPYPAYLDPLAPSTSDESSSVFVTRPGNPEKYSVSKIAEQSFLSLSTTTLASRRTSRSSGVFSPSTGLHEIGGSPVLLSPVESDEGYADALDLLEDPLEDWRKFHLEMLDDETFASA